VLSREPLTARNSQRKPSRVSAWHDFPVTDARPKRGPSLESRATVELNQLKVPAPLRTLLRAPPAPQFGSCRHGPPFGRCSRATSPSPPLLRFVFFSSTGNPALTIDKLNRILQQTKHILVHNSCTAAIHRPPAVRPYSLTRGSDPDHLHPLSTGFCSLSRDSSPDGSGLPIETVGILKCGTPAPPSHSTRASPPAPSIVASCCTVHQLIQHRERPPNTTRSRSCLGAKSSPGPKTGQATQEVLVKQITAAKLPWPLAFFFERHDANDSPIPLGRNVTTCERPSLCPTSRARQGRLPSAKKTKR
jgi:hypothetical protein